MAEEEKTGQEQPEGGAGAAQAGQGEGGAGANQTGQEQPEGGAGADQAGQGEGGESAAAAYAASFTALKDSVFQGRDLRRQQRELDAYVAQTDASRKEHADRVDILENYDARVAEQQQLADEAQAALDAGRPKLEQARDDLALAQGRLDSAKADHKSALEQLKARNDKEERELSTALADAKDARKRAEEQHKAAAKTAEGVAAAQADRLKRALDEAKAREHEADDALKDAKAGGKRALRDLRQEHADAERPLQDELAKAKAQVRDLEDELAARGKALAAANERLAYCRAVREDPAAADALQATIAERDDVARQMRDKIASLAQTHAQSKAGSKKALVVVVAIAALVIVIAIVALVLANR